MEQRRWDRIEELLQAALDLDGEEREHFLARECGSDADLRRQVEDLLAAGSDDRLDASAVASMVPHLVAGTESGLRISHYRIEGAIGSGGMGEVYLARDEALQRNVALKTLPPEFMADPERVRRFEQEAFTVSRLNHPNIITIFDVVHSEGTHWIATEYVEGMTVRALLQEPIPLDRALDITIQVAAALKAAHTAWIIHRDIKPENLMVRPDGVVKVLDFGIAKLSETADPEPATAAATGIARPDATIPGRVLGTKSYMSPEQASGAPLDGRTDLYSLGVVLREMAGDARVPKPLARVLDRMLRPNRDERYASAGELLDDLVTVRRRLELTTSRRLVGGSILAAAAAFALTAVAAVLSITESWEERVLRDGHVAAARHAVFSPDGRTLVSCGEDGRIIVWDFARRERLAALPQHATALAFSPDGRWFASGGPDGQASLWDARTLRPVRVMKHGQSVHALAFSPDSSLLITGQPFGFTLWETASGKMLQRWPGGMSHGTFVFPNGNRVLLGSTLTLVDLASGRVVEEREGQANWIAMTPDGARFATIDTRGGVRFYRFTNRERTRHELRAHRPAHQDHGRAVAYSPDGKLLASAAEDIVVWDAERMEKVARFQYDSIVWSVAFSPDGRWVISTHGDGAVLVWDVAERQRVASLNAHSGAVRAVAFHPDGQRLVTGGEDRVVIVWNLSTGRKERVLAGHPTRVTAVAFSHDGQWIASTDHEGGAMLWTGAQLRPQAFVRPQETNSYCIALSPDDRLLATSHALYGVRDGFLHITFRSSPATLGYGQIYAGAWVAGSRRFAGVTDGGWALVWDVVAKRVAAAHRIPETHLVAASVSPDGKWMVSGEDEGTVRLWSIDPLRPVAVIGRHAARVKSVAFSPDGKRVASAGDDKMLAIWDVGRRRLVTRVGTHTSPIYAIAFSPDGRQLASGEHDRSARVYTRTRTLWGFELE
jgi:WD40 repeat protein